MSLAYVYFKPCPKCSETDLPQINIGGCNHGESKYRAKCKTCHYEQNHTYNSVKECAEAWNKESDNAWIEERRNIYKELHEPLIVTAPDSYICPVCHQDVVPESNEYELLFDDTLSMKLGPRCICQIKCPNCGYTNHAPSYKEALKKWEKGN